MISSGPRDSVEITPATRRQLRKLPRDVQTRIVSVLTALEGDPRPLGVKKLKDRENQYRIRVDAYRVIYTIADTRLIVLILEVGDGKDIYD